MSRKVLIFTYYWPPAGGVAVQRWLKFAKYLPEFGWEPIIVTVENGSYPYYDESLLKEVSPSLRVYRTKTFEPFEIYNLLRGKRGKSVPTVAVGAHGGKTLFQKMSEYIRANCFVPDARKGWIPYAVKQADKILKNEHIDVVITTGPPHSAHLVGLKLKKKYGVKWVADFRDPWTGIFYNKLLPRNRKAENRDKQLESLVLSQSDMVTVISNGMKKEFSSRSTNLQVILNGYDKEDFDHQQPLLRTSKVLTIRYVGNFIESQNVEPLWIALSNLLEKGFKIQLEFIGRVDEGVKRYISQSGLAAYVTYKSFVSHKESIQLMQKADLLLFVIPDVKDNELILTGKLFEYLASCTEIFSIGPVSGDAADILKITGRKEMIDYRNSEEMRRQLFKLCEDFEEKQSLIKYSDSKHYSFSRHEQTKLLAAKLELL